MDANILTALGSMPVGLADLAAYLKSDLEEAEGGLL